MIVKKYGFCHIIAEYHDPDSWRGCESGRFPVQNAHIIVYADENTTFEPGNGYDFANENSIYYPDSDLLPVSGFDCYSPLNFHGGGDRPGRSLYSL